eukprot:6310202-Pyramimonas_sp.AAC.1
MVGPEAEAERISTRRALCGASAASSLPAVPRRMRSLSVTRSDHYRSHTAITIGHKQRSLSVTRSDHNRSHTAITIGHTRRSLSVTPIKHYRSHAAIVRRDERAQRRTCGPC